MGCCQASRSHPPPSLAPTTWCQINEMLWALRAPMFGLVEEFTGGTPPLMVDIGEWVGQHPTWVAPTAQQLAH